MNYLINFQYQSDYDDTSIDEQKTTTKTTTDLFQGYWMIEMEDSSKEKTTFICPYLKYTSEVMSMELKNLGTTRQRMKNKRLADVENFECYFYGLVIHKKTRKEHAALLEIVLKLLWNNGLCHSSSM